MAKLTKKEAKDHAEAMRLVDSGHPLGEAEKEIVLANYHEGATHINSLAGAFFTPAGLANDFALHVPDGARVLDLCAGIGRLSYAVGFVDELPGPSGATSIVCVEQNAEYVRVGRRVLPRATWVEADVFDLAAYQHLGPFDCVISNPPFGRVKTGRGSSPLALPRYTGTLFEFRVIELATRLAPYAAFIVPQMSAPFQYSGKRSFEWVPGPGREFVEATGIKLGGSIGIDTSVYDKDWRGTPPKTEIVIYDPTE